MALWADQLRDISAPGLHFSENVYDPGCYRATENIAMEMLALAAGKPLDQITPLRASVFTRPTPMAAGDAAVIDDAGRILLIQRADNSLWAMPGGALKVGETPAEGVVREALEETGIRCRAASLIGVFDSQFCGSTSRHHLCQFLFLAEPLDHRAKEGPFHTDEARDMGWLPENALPADIDPGHASRIPEAFCVWHGDHRAFFDGAVFGGHERENVC
jgi:ADP-ribose pyrophosphatase YjhB (NUDIX family)